jgi:hypothetical protein
MIGRNLVGLAGVGLTLWLTGISSDAQTASPPDSLAGINIALPSGPVSALSLTPADMPELKKLSDAQLEVFINALEAAPQIPFSALPRRSAGSYFSLANPDFPPFPGDVNMLPVWKLNGFYVLNDLSVSNQPTAMMIASDSHVKAQLSGPGAPGGGGTNPPPKTVIYTPPNYGSNLWIGNVYVSAGYFNGLASNTLADVLYQVLGTTNLLIPFGNWQSEGFFNGSELTNCTPFSVWQNGQNPLFVQLLSWQDSYDTGIPDWWWFMYYGQNTNVSASASAANDGFSNLQKFELGIVPTNYYNPYPLTNFFGALDPSGTNAFVYWGSAPGPVVNYVIQRTNGLNDTYFTVSSNVFLFKDTGAITNANAQNNVYNVWAVYPGGSTTGTDSWQVSDYTANFTDGPPDVPPQPTDVYAYADGTGTNFVLTWGVVSPPPANYTIFRGLYNTTSQTYSYSQIAVVGTNAISYTDTNAITNDNSWNNEYQIEAVYPGGVVSTLETANLADPYEWMETGANTNGPAAPTDFYGYADSTGTNFYLSWNLEPGAVTNYILYGGYHDEYSYDIIFHRVAKLNSTANSYAANGATNACGQPYSQFNLVAVCTNGAVSQSAVWYLASSSPAPITLIAYLDITQTNVLLAWTPVQGATGIRLGAVTTTALFIPH